MPVARSADRPTFELQGNVITGLAAPGRGAAETTMYRVRIPAGSSLPAHRHDHEEVFHLLEGFLTWVGDGEEHDLAAGDTVMIPAGVLHHASTVAGAEMLAAMPVRTLFIPEGGEGNVPPWGE